MEIVNSSKKYNSDGQMIYSCQYHVIFCTKYRRKVLTEKIQQRLKEIVLKNQEKGLYNIIEMEIMEDHVHLLIDINPKIGIYKTISYIKGLSSNLLRKEFKELKTRIPCLWTTSRFISTVGSVSLDIVKSYIENQKNV